MSEERRPAGMVLAIVKAKRGKRLKVESSLEKMTFGTVGEIPPPVRR